MIIDGKAIAQELLEETRRTASLLPHTPSFAALAVAPSGATESYLRIKYRLAAQAGINMEVITPDNSITTQELVELMQKDVHDALIVQLPLPQHIDQAAVLDVIPPEKDADVLSPITRSQGMLMHPIAAAIGEIFARAGVEVAGKSIVVIGNGWLVGQPVTAWLTRRGVSVTVVTKESMDVEAVCRNADILIAGAGVPGLVTSSMVKVGAVVIDVGTSELGGSIAGDVAPEVVECASVFTPVPGGVGPIAVACLMKNVVELARLRTS